MKGGDKDLTFHYIKSLIIQIFPGIHYFNLYKSSFFIEIVTQKLISERKYTIT